MNRYGESNRTNREKAMRGVHTMQDIVDWRMCIGCGACYSYCERQAVKLVNVLSVGIRPVFKPDICASCNECLSFCPGYNVMPYDPKQSGNGNSSAELGPVLEIWEGYATDDEMRFKGASGGAMSAVALYCMEREKMAFTLHTGMDTEKSWINRTYKSHTREDLLERSGSRYAPSSPCDSFKAIGKTETPFVFIGRPCDVMGTAKLRKTNPGLNASIGITMAHFCAGSPSTQGTLDLISEFGLSASSVQTVRYRGEGWPGRFVVRTGSEDSGKSLSYEDSWKKLNKYCSFRCRICPDGLGREADLSFGDAWHKKNGSDEKGLSIVIVRTEKGRDILHRAIEAGYVHLTPITKDDVVRAQKNLVMKHRYIWGRLLAMKLLFVPTPKIRNYHLFTSWKSLPAGKKVRSILGTMRRVVSRNLWQKKSIV